MFLKALQKQNSELISTAIAMHRNGEILPDSYVFDVDAFTENVKKIQMYATEYGIKLYGMTKQFGRNPILARILMDIGFDGIVAVDFKEARLLHRVGIKISHIGHLVQIPSKMVEEVVSIIRPEVITVYSLIKAKEISDAAKKAGVTQKLLLKFYAEGDCLFINQESGFPISEMDKVVRYISALDNVVIEGLTHFPCFLVNEEGNTIPTPNFKTLLTAKKMMEEKGVRINQVNTPSSTSHETIPVLAAQGATHGEPGHALTGTTPSNINGTQVEKMSMLYLSEVSHQFNNKSYCYGGGFYRRGLLDMALIDGTEVKVTNDDTDSIDYHLLLDGIYPIGSSVVMAFRTQIFVTRSDVVLIKGISVGKPEIIGIYNSLGQEI
ncbi:YhfX family PLP-dependent enzyme [Vibrio sp.]|uniref:YhfX family PLP-dependent enzyme n=1 Tax=Vibrio sp. TaxID=678 RepID=UPI003AA8D77F